MTGGARVLLVEDDAADKGCRRRSLTAHGYDVEVAGDVAGALRAWDAIGRT